MQGASAVIVGCARDCAPFLPQVLRNIERLASLYTEAAFIFVENDSTDSTKDILRAWCRSQPRTALIEIDGLAACCPVRTIRLEKARKVCLATARAHCASYRHLIVLDCDDLNLRAYDLAAIERAADFLDSMPENGAVFAGQDGSYYDLFAFRHPLRCPGDVWEEAFDYALANNVSREEAFKQTVMKRVFMLPADAPPFEVQSAFGGLGIYKMASALNNKRGYFGYTLKRLQNAAGVAGLPWQVCEHVAFNAGIREQGQRLLIVPSMVNGRSSRIVVAPHPLHDPDHSFEWKWVPMPESVRANIRDANALCPCASGLPYAACHGDPALPPVPKHLRPVLEM